ncbi:hypothetical protein ACH4TV_23345 [Streptomyces sp. NPDC020898]
MNQHPVSEARRARDELERARVRVGLDTVVRADSMRDHGIDRNRTDHGTP